MEGSTERRLLQTLVENATWKCGVLQTKLFEPIRNSAPFEPRKLWKRKGELDISVVSTGMLEIRPKLGPRFAKPGQVSDPAVRDRSRPITLRPDRLCAASGSACDNHHI